MLTIAVGIIDEDDDVDVDLGMLERKLLEKRQLSIRESHIASHRTSPSQATSGQDGGSSLTPNTSITTPEPSHKDRDSDQEKRRSNTPHDKRQSDAPEDKRQDEEEVATLSEMMCSLVTNNSGETRYIGAWPSFFDFSVVAFSEGTDVYM